MNAAKREQEDAVDGQNCRGKNHQEGEDGERDVIALAAQREHAHDHAEQCQMDGGGQETAGKEKIVGSEEDEIGDGERGGPALGNDELSALGQQVAADGEGGAHRE